MFYQSKAWVAQSYVGIQQENSFFNIILRKTFFNNSICNFIWNQFAFINIDLANTPISVWLAIAARNITCWDVGNAKLFNNFRLCPLYLHQVNP